MQSTCPEKNHFVTLRLPVLSSKTKKRTSCVYPSHTDTDINLQQCSLFWEDGTAQLVGCSTFDIFPFCSAMNASANNSFSSPAIKNYKMAFLWGTEWTEQADKWESKSENRGKEKNHENIPSNWLIGLHSHLSVYCSEKNIPAIEKAQLRSILWPRTKPNRVLGRFWGRKFKFEFGNEIWNDYSRW